MAFCDYTLYIVTDVTQQQTTEDLAQPSMRLHR